MQPPHTHTKYPPLPKTWTEICYILWDGKGAEGSNMNLISHTNRSFIWLNLFDNAHTVAYFQGWVAFCIA